MIDKKTTLHQKKSGVDPSQRLIDSRASIHFYILFDLDLNANHLRIYGQIEQMESNPSPHVAPSFSYEWLSSQLKIDRRSVIRSTKLLKEKGYIEHVKINGIWVWKTTKSGVINKAVCNKLAPDSDAQRHPLVTPSVTPPSDAQCHPHYINNIYNNIYKKNTLNFNDVNKDYKKTFYNHLNTTWAEGIEEEISQ